MKSLLILLALSILNSCSPKKELIEGYWQIGIHDILYKNEDISFSLSGNSIRFDKDYCSFPILWDGTQDQQKPVIGFWDLLDKSGNTYRININVNNQYYNGIYDVDIAYDENKNGWVMEMHSEHMEIKCLKINGL